jgi:LDH2 family malate/lactate/ureidoglycolate dehydrogenase
VVRDIRNSERLPGVDRIWIPGEQSHGKRQRYAQSGVPVMAALVDELDALAREWGIASLTERSAA